MSSVSLTIRVLLACTLAFIPVPGLERWCADALFALRGRLRSETPIVLVPLENTETLPHAVDREQASHPRHVVDYPPAALAEDTRPDLDCTVRHADLEGGASPSPTLLSYHRLIGTSGKTGPVFPLRIDFRGPAGSYPQIREETLFAEPSPDFRDKVVLIGPANAEAPRTAVGPMSALELQANILETLWRDRSLRTPPPWATTLSSLATIGVTMGSILWMPLRYTWAALAALTAFWWIVGVVFLAFAQILLSIAGPLVCLFWSHLLLYGFKVRRREAEYWKTQKDVEYGRQLEEFKNNFISLFSHDLKTPIARIKAVVHGALNGNEAVPPKILDSLKNIDRASEELARLINDILKVTKMESMSLQLERDAVDLNRMVEQAAARLKHLADDKKIRLVLDLEPLFPIEGDPQLIQEIILNLVENAVKYGRPETDVTIRTQEETGRILVTVRDQGMGIPADELPRVAGKFYRARNAATKTSGSGLGLFLAKYFVELHHGALDIQSHEGQGTEVSFWLPSPV